MKCVVCRHVCVHFSARRCLQAVAVEGLNYSWNFLLKNENHTKTMQLFEMHNRGTAAWMSHVKTMWYNNIFERTDIIHHTGWARWVYGRHMWKQWCNNGAEQTDHTPHWMGTFECKLSCSPDVDRPSLFTQCRGTKRPCFCSKLARAYT